MGKTSSRVKDKYNAKAYDNITVRVFKGQKLKIAAHAKLRGESVNGFINRAINETMERDSMDNPNQNQIQSAPFQRLESDDDSTPDTGEPK